ncbi:thioesterase domain-containing protein [Pseudoprimorskyibacter insulae]|uniref:Dimodular nonribosomal peptide synthase n=1 Tax=Pseudoprimorskyibacter insulae TaxID=1695997 RepID=A0A2R8ATV1_9RHOB|nr:polyketide synthase dehydratase domain-containing protein [Pseudoprimorskyibacter insulae]SPF79481.1 Dimodular nonribosomal peptide synthase [Pseudoprimorskyibacter insulae]
MFSVDWGRWADDPAHSADTFDSPIDGSALLTAQRSPKSAPREMIGSIKADHWLAKGYAARSGTALLPGTAYVSLAAQAMIADGATGPFKLSDLLALRPFLLPAGQDRGIKLHLTKRDDGTALDILASDRWNGEPCHVLTAQTTLAPIPAHERPAGLDIAAIAERCPKAETPALMQTAHLAYGDRWYAPATTLFGEGEALAQFITPEQAANDQGYGLHPAVLDSAMGWALALIDGYSEADFWAPTSCSELRIHGPLPTTFYSWVRIADAASASEDSARFDITLSDETGAVCIEIRGYTLKRFDNVADLLNAPAPDRADVRMDVPEPTIPTAEERYQEALSAVGLTSAEGASAFMRALATNLPNVVVSSVDPASLAAHEAARVPDAPQATADDAEGAATRAMPENDIEARLLAFWEQLLGLPDIGVEDSFFDLGGHSLIAVRLFALIRKTYKVEFPISVLFSAPTIRACADLIAKRIGSDGDAGDGVDQANLKHVVAMHDGAPGPGTPFFLVAGCFGNVLNLRHLGHLLGGDRPFYGMQAKGLFGGEEPHQTFEDTARDYIAEMKQVQPQGPYMIGGFSGGGVTAYEIAQQLKAMGEEATVTVILDSALPRRRPLKAIDRVMIQLQEIRRKGIAYPYIWIRNRIRWELTKHRGTFEAAETEHQFHNAEVEAGWENAASVYDVQPYDGRVLVFRPPMTAHWTVAGGRMVDHQRSYVFHDNDWGQYAANIEVHEVPGDHDTIVLEPNVRVLAAIMGEILNEADASLQKGSPFRPSSHHQAAQ